MSTTSHGPTMDSFNILGNKLKDRHLTYVILTPIHPPTPTPSSPTPTPVKRTFHWKKSYNAPLHYKYIHWDTSIMQHSSTMDTPIGVSVKRHVLILFYMKVNDQFGLLYDPIYTTRTPQIWPTRSIDSCLCHWGPFYLYQSTLIPAWLSNHIPSNVRDTIIYPFPN